MKSLEFQFKLAALIKDSYSAAKFSFHPGDNLISEW